ncbi:HAD family hydrolase [Nonomuraea sp. NPDC049269]|uniref:HAD family hydrolase n=1 Tax=Nonomuraea sp. NPDC049269 TaxID=3364349 RepID=UPI0037104F46
MLDLDNTLVDRDAAFRDATTAFLAEATCDALGSATANGWICTIATNGRTMHQEAKIRNTGLDRLVHGWTISEAIGHRKPESEIFMAAAHRLTASTLAT